MPFANGSFTLNSTYNPVVTGTSIQSAWANSTLQDMATGLSTCLLKDGTQILTANIPFGNFKLTGLAVGTTAGDSLRYEQVFTTGNFPIAGNATVAGNLVVSGTTTGVDETLTGNLSVGGNGTITGNGTVTGNLTVNGNQTIAGNLTVSGTYIPTLQKFTSSLAGDVALGNVSAYGNGPSVAQGTAGTWLAMGTVTVVDTGGAAQIRAKLWDGTTIIASTQELSVAANSYISIPLSGYITSPAGNIRIDVQDASNTTGKILFNQSTNSKDSTVTVVRITP